jgi:hypothetical protein
MVGPWSVEQGARCGRTQSAVRTPSIRASETAASTIAASGGSTPIDVASTFAVSTNRRRQRRGLVRRVGRRWLCQISSCAESSHIQRAAFVGWVVAFVIERLKREKLRSSVKMTGAVLPLPTVTLAEIAPVFTPGPFGPALATEVACIGHGPVAVPGGTSDAEAWILSVLAKQARCGFEFGTCTGRTSCLWARNAPPDARSVTLALVKTLPIKHLRGTTVAAYRRPLNN